MKENLSKDGEGEGKGEGNVDGEGVDREKGEKDGEGIGFDEHIWDDMNDEVEAAMNESDDDESVRTGGKSGNVSEDDWTDESNSVIRCVCFSHNQPTNLLSPQTYFYSSY